LGELFLHKLDEYIEKYGCQVFFETGTGIGTGLLHAMKYDFKILYSTEINKDLFKQNIPLLADDRVRLLNVESVVGLHLALALHTEDEPILFWLDAHFPGADFGLGKYDDPMDESIRLPLESELQTIKGIRPNAKDVFIIDDLQLYEDGPYELKYEPFVDKYKRKPDFIYEMYWSQNERTVYEYGVGRCGLLVPATCSG
jgi:hypothetical protein